ncbi:MAG: Ig-like domain-containing protein, partial [Neofamilia sp.]
MELTATVTPDNAFKGVIWSSSDETKATVDENGVVTGHWSPLTMPLKKERVPTTAVMEFVIDGVSYT